MSEVLNLSFHAHAQGMGELDRYARSLNTQMKKLLTIFLLLVLAPNFSALAAETLCEPAEKIFFNCSVTGSMKVVSVCGTQNTSASEGYVQYRFGHPGKIEFEFPSSRIGSMKVFWWDGRIHRDVTDDWFWFKNGGFIYSLYAIEDHDTPSRKPEFRTGVMIAKQGQDTGGRDLKCSQRASGDFKRLAEIIEWKEME